MTQNSYIKGELAEGPASGEPQHRVLRLTTDDVTRATGVQIKAGMTIEHRYSGHSFEVRIQDTAGDLLADWTTVDG